MLFPVPSQIDLVRGMVDCLYAECKPCITDCVMAELEKLGQKYRVALKVAKVGVGHCWVCWSGATRSRAVVGANAAGYVYGVQGICRRLGGKRRVALKVAKERGERGQCRICACIAKEQRSCMCMAKW